MPCYHVINIFTTILLNIYWKLNYCWAVRSTRTSVTEILHISLILSIHDWQIRNIPINKQSYLSNVLITAVGVGKFSVRAEPGTRVGCLEVSFTSEPERIPIFRTQNDIHPRSVRTGRWEHGSNVVRVQAVGKYRKVRVVERFRLRYLLCSLAERTVWERRRSQGSVYIVEKESELFSERKNRSTVCEQWIRRARHGQ